MSITDFYYPETAVGGFTRNDEAIELYARVNALVSSESVVIDLGAGRGERFHADTTNAYSRSLCRLQGKVARLIGIDVDDAIMDHPFLDERHIVDLEDPFPVADDSVDLIVSEWVLEHVDNPALFAAEIDRVLKPGGWFCAITPNALGYVGIANRLLTPAIKTRLLRHVWPGRFEIDVFPTHYRLNTDRALKRAFDPDRWRHRSYTSNPSPKYHGNRAWAFRAIRAYQGVMPDSLKTNLLIFIQKR